MVEVCDGCGTEYIVGARFCHICGADRQAQANVMAGRNWTRYLEFQNIKQGLGLQTASLIAFLIGVGSLLWTLSVGLVYGVQTFSDFQAVQYFRIQGLLTAVAAFLAGILLKRGPGSQD
jgi:hypothetical protein